MSSCEAAAWEPVIPLALKFVSPGTEVVRSAFFSVFCIISTNIEGDDKQSQVCAIVLGSVASVFQ